MRKNNKSSYRPARKSTGNTNAGQPNPLKAILAKYWEPFVETVELAGGQTLQLQVGAPTVAAYEAAHRYPAGTPENLFPILESGLPEYQQHYVHTPEVEAVLKKPAFAAKIKEQIANCERRLEQAHS